MSLNFRNQIVKNGDVNISVNVMGSSEPLLLIPFCERVIGSIRRGCLDHVIVLNERHLRRFLS